MPYLINNSKELDNISESWSPFLFLHPTAEKKSVLNSLIASKLRNLKEVNKIVVNFANSKVHFYLEKGMLWMCGWMNGDVNLLWMFIFNFAKVEKRLKGYIEGSNRWFKFHK